jgi:6-phosphogluconolactonase
MKSFVALIRGFTVAAITTIAGGTSAMAATFVYVSNAEDGDISAYRMLDSGELQPGARTRAASVVMPMAVSPDRRFLYAASRSKPYRVHVYAIDRGTGELKQFSASPLAESFPYISLDKTGRFLFGASYGGNVVSVNAVESDGRVAVEPLQVIPVGRHAHSIRVDATNRFVYVPTLGSDAIFMFTFDAKTGKLSSNTPAIYLAKPVTGPRHFVTSGDNRFVYLLSEMTGTVTTLAVDGKTGLLTEVSAVSGLPPDTKLVPGALRGSIPGRNMDNDIWANTCTSRSAPATQSAPLASMRPAASLPTCRARPPSVSRADLPSIRRGGSSSPPAKNRTRFPCTPSTRPLARSSS